MVAMYIEVICIKLKPSIKIQYFVYNVYLTNQFRTIFARGWGGGLREDQNPVVEWTVNSKDTFVPIMSTNSASGLRSADIHPSFADLVQ
jgi:hypothetical protein